MTNEANLVGPQDSIPFTNKRQETGLFQHQPVASTSAKKKKRGEGGGRGEKRRFCQLFFLLANLDSSSRVKVDQPQLLRVARMSNSDACIDQLFDMRRVVVTMYQVHIRICRLTDRQVHDVFQYVFQFENAGILGLRDMAVKE